MRFLLVLILPALVAACQSLGALSEPTEQRSVMFGRIDPSFDGLEPKDIKVTVNGRLAELTPDGRFTLEVPQAPYYRITASGVGIYSAIQTFGIAELYRHNCDCLEAPALAVVARKPGRVALFFAGDVMAGRRYVEPIWGERQLIDPEDPLPDMLRLLDPMKPYIESADFASANLEIVLSEQEFSNSPPKSVIFYAHPALASALKQVGFDHVSLGNNHSYDYLEDGLATTIEAVESAGLAWSGAGFDEEQALRASKLSILGEDLCLLGYVGWKGRVEPNQVAETGKGGAAFGSEENIAASVTRDAETGCAVVAQYHGSREYSDGPTEESERRMKLAVESGAALIASHHPHVAQGIELYKESLIAYSLGNFLFDQYFLETHGSIALRVWLDEGRFARAEVIPLRILDYRPVPAVGRMREAILDRIERLSAQHDTKVLRDAGHGLVLADSKLELRPKLSAPRTGLEILRSGDFESGVFKVAVDRSLKLEGGTIDYRFIGSGGHYLALESNRTSDAIRLTTSTFFRVVPGRHVTISGKVRSSRPFRLGVASQLRPANMGRFAALEEAPFDEHAGRKFESGDHWQEFAVAFDLDDTNGTRPFRPRLEFTALEPDPPSALSVDLDDLRIVVRELDADTLGGTFSHSQPGSRLVYPATR